MERGRLGWLLLAMGTAALPARGSEIVIPARYAAVEAASYTLIPFGRMGTVRLQQVYEGFLFPAGVTSLVGLAVRADEDGLASAKSDVDMEIQLGSGGPGVTSLSQRFASNRPPSTNVVFRRRKVHLPAQSPGLGPMPFTMRFALDAPFPFSRSSGPLLVEMVVFDQSGSGHSCDAPYLSASARSDFGPPGCKGSNDQFPLALCRTVSVQWGESLQIEIQRLLPGAGVLLGFGLDDQGSWAGLPLPFDLGPAGAPGCWLSLGFLILVGGKADTLGQASFFFRLPRSPQVLGSWIFFQGVGQDQAANPLGLTFSAGHRVQVSGPEALGRVYHFDLTAQDGLAQVGLAHVMQFLTP